MSDGYYEENGFRCKNGRAYVEGGAHCNKKLCFTATDVAYLVSVLDDLAAREDAFWVKYQPVPRDGMHLGRAFFTSPTTVGQLWSKYKKDGKLLCSVQDDDFVAPYR